MDERKTCSTCTHWDQAPKGEQGRCKAIGDREEKALASSGGCTSEDSADSWFQTRSDFGCVLHNASVEALAFTKDGGTFETLRWREVLQSDERYVHVQIEVTGLFYDAKTVRLGALDVRRLETALHVWLRESDERISGIGSLSTTTSLRVKR